MENGADTAVGTWTVPECPFEIDYFARTLDDIRLAVVDAFFSVPRGGAEIGGILLGQVDGRHVSITDYEPLDCEHALGPSFTLSPRDQSRLAEMIARARRNPSDRQPVGWYHSHTRTEIFLSDADQDIHGRFFPEPWQVALVLKPHTFEPMRAGFFFRDRAGAMRATASYREFRLDPLPLRANGAAGGNGSGSDRVSVRDEAGVRAALASLTGPEPPLDASEPPPEPAKSKGRVPITREIPVAPPVETAEVTPEGSDLEVPDFGQNRQQRSWRAVKAAVILAIGLALGGVGYQTRQYWLPKVVEKARAVLPREPDSYLALAVADDNGQLKIQWDRNAPAVRNALEGTLEISDGNTVPQSVRLDSGHLALGVFTYGRQNERVDVTLMTSEPSGQIVKEQSSFLGKLPATKAEAPPTPKDNDAAQRAEKLQKDLNVQAAKTRKLEKDLKDMREKLESQQKARQETPQDRD